MKNLLLTAAAAALLSTASIFAADQPAELEALKNFLGKWELKVNEAADAKGVRTAEWILGGRFLQQTWSIETGDGNVPNMSGTTISTYDTDKNTYRSWQFLSNGSTSESEGKWDAATKTFTWTSTAGENGVKSVSKSTFGKDGVEQWSITATGSSGETVMSLTGTHTRKP